jgi:tetratricopeptide (TPR) repeat protein
MMERLRMTTLFKSREHTHRNLFDRGGRRAGLRVAGAMLVLVGLLQGCAAPHARNTETTHAVHHDAVVTREQKADFEEAMKLADNKEYEKAADLLSKVANAEPDNAIPAINLALVYEKMGKMKEAEDALKSALKADPDNPVAANEYALLYRKTGRFAEARALYEKTLEKYPHFIMMHKNLGVLCDLYLKDYACAIAHYTAYSEVKPDDKTVKMWIADLKQRSGK